MRKTTLQVFMAAIWSVFALAQETPVYFDKQAWEKQGFKDVQVNRLKNSVERKSLNIPLVLVASRYSSFTPEKIRSDFSQMQSIFSHCDVSFHGSVLVQASDHNQGSFIRYDEDDPQSIENFRPRVPVKSDRPVLFYIKEVADREDQSGFSVAEWSSGVGLKPNLYNTIWLTDYSLSDEYRRDHNDDQYNLAAHELAHALTLKGMHIAPHFESLLSISRARTNHILKKTCDLIHENPNLHSN